MLCALNPVVSEERNLPSNGPNVRKQQWGCVSERSFGRVRGGDQLVLRIPVFVDVNAKERCWSALVWIRFEELQHTLREFELRVRQRLYEIAVRESSVEKLMANKERQIVERYEAREKELLRLQKQVDEKIQSWSKMQELKMIFGPIVKINVGGSAFQTSLQTVQKVRSVHFITLDIVRVFLLVLRLLWRAAEFRC